MFVGCTLDSSMNGINQFIDTALIDFRGVFDALIDCEWDMGHFGPVCVM